MDHRKVPEPPALQRKNASISQYFLALKSLGFFRPVSVMRESCKVSRQNYWLKGQAANVSGVDVQVSNEVHCRVGTA
jgi:hypothetical protein